MFTAFRVAMMLKADGIKFVSYDESEDDATDGIVDLTDKVHIQVGKTYLCLVKETEGGCFQWLHETSNLANMVYFVRTMIMEGKI